MRGRSRNALAPLHTVTTGWRAIAPRSALTSAVSATSRCTPPIPPVANTPIPTRAAKVTVAETVVAPNPTVWASATGRSRSATLVVAAWSRSCSSSASPTTATPSTIAVIAGVTPRLGAGGVAAFERLGSGAGGKTERAVDRTFHRDHRTVLVEGSADGGGDVDGVHDGGA